MPIDFPNSPSANDSFSSSGKTWVYNGSAWIVQGAIPIIADSSIDSSKLVDGSVTETKIASNAISTAKIDSQVTLFTTCTSITRPASPFTGQIIFETDTNSLLAWSGTAWISIGLRPPLAPTSLSATPGSTSVDISFTAGSSPVSAISNYEYAISTNSGSTYGSWTALSPADSSSPITVSGLSMGTSYAVKLRGVNEVGSGIESASVSFTTLSSIAVEYLVIAGGGAGGYERGGGGGAGGYRTNMVGATSGGGASAEAAMNISPGTYTVTVGSGGAANSNAGTNSVFNGITSLGGGAGASTRTSGGSGGGGRYTGDTTGAAGTSGQGYAGGNGVYAVGSGGGGGAGAAGANAGNSWGGAGGNGVSSSITGSAVTRGGGGGGGGDYGNGVAGGSGGGGASANGGVSGTANTGGGGGGGNWQGAAYNGGNGGSGVVIIRYLTSSASGFTITGGTATTSGSYTVRTFNSTANLVIS